MDSKLISKIIKKVPEAIGIGIGLSLLSIGAPYFILGILVPDYEIDFNKLLPRWASVCVVLTFIYYWRKEKS
jgi:hypothetical protein